MRLVLSLILYASIVLPTITLALLVPCPVDPAAKEIIVALGIFALAALVVFICARCIPADDEKSDNTEDKGSADEKPEEYKEDETDLYDIIVNKPAETTDEKPVDAATETTDGTAGTGAEDATDDKA